MAEYIERESLIADIEKRYCRPCEAEGKDYNHVRCRACWVDDMVGEIGEALFYDVVPVVHGLWIKHLDFWRKCSECGASWHEQWVLSKALNYCPNCGARMDGE